MRRLIIIGVVAILALLVSANTVLAKGPNGPAGQSNVGHINLVEKDATWAIIGDWGKLTYSLSGGMLDVVLNARGLVPGGWYLIELNDKSAPSWTVISPTAYSSFYAQANGSGNIHAALSNTVASGMQVEVNVKNAEWAALLDPSTIGVPSEWAGPTGQGWTYVLYSADTIAVP